MAPAQKAAVRKKASTASTPARKKIPAATANKKAAGKKDEATPNGTAQKPTKRSVKVGDDAEGETAPAKKCKADETTDAPAKKKHKVVAGKSEPATQRNKLDLQTQLDHYNLTERPEDDLPAAQKNLGTWSVSQTFDDSCHFRQQEEGF
jgi:hypothetical protein